MIVPITPVSSSFKFGTATHLLLRSVSDDLETSAIFFWQLGKLVTPELRTVTSTKLVSGKSVTAEEDVQDPDGFVGDDAATGNCTLSGADYSAWTGSNVTLPVLVVSQIGVTLSK